MNVYKIFFFFLLLNTCLCLIRITSPEEFAKDYAEANLNVYPRQFEVNASLVVADPWDGCTTYRNIDEIKGRIVIVYEGGPCSPQEKTKRISEYGGVGAILAGVKGSLGIFYNFATKPDPSVLLPALSTPQKDFQKVIDYVKSNPEVNVTMTMHDTDRNPFLEWAHSGAGIVFQIYFEILAFATFVIGSYKLFNYIRYKGLVFHVPPIILFFEICASVLRMVLMTRPLSFYSFGFNILGDAFLLGYSNDLSFTTDLLITFYWQEILIKCDRKLSNKVLNNLSKFRIPFAIATLIIWVLDTVTNLSRGLVIRTFSNSVIFTAIVYVIFTFIIASFFLFTGIKVLRVTGITSKNRKMKRVSKLMAIIVVTGSLMIVQIIAIILYVSPAATDTNAQTILFIFWLWWSGLFGVSLTKVIMLDTKTKKDSSEMRGAEKLSKEPEGSTMVDTAVSASENTVDNTTDIELTTNENKENV